MRHRCTGEMNGDSVLVYRNLPVFKSVLYVYILTKAKNLTVQFLLHYIGDGSVPTASCGWWPGPRLRVGHPNGLYAHPAQSHTEQHPHPPKFPPQDNATGDDPAGVSPVTTVFLNQNQNPNAFIVIVLKIQRNYRAAPVKCSINKHNKNSIKHNKKQ